jgi:glutamyl-Q tRNA(Asp) synthetase
MKTRFAPSPTGYLHLGHIVSALYVWGVAQKQKAQVFVRLEDHDRQRCRPYYAEAILEDLRWLGFIDSRTPVHRQSHHWERYHEAMQRLKSAGCLYACQCSRKNLQPLTEMTLWENHYPGTCRNLHVADNEKTSKRFMIKNSIVSFFDQRHGIVSQCPSSQCGDMSVQDRNGNFTYQFCNVVDDLIEDVGLIIRGDDLLASTGRQMLLREALGEKNHPIYIHHPLVFEKNGEKLSKSLQSEPICKRREKGEKAEEVLAAALLALGITTGASCSLPEALNKIEMDHIRGPLHLVHSSAV